MMDMATRYTEFWMGAIWAGVSWDGQRQRGGEEAYNQVADENLQNLGPQTGAVLERLLQGPDEAVAERGADEGAVRRHLGHARRKVVAVLVAVLGQPRGDQLLSTGEGAGREHLGPHRVVLELLDVGLNRISL